MSVEPGQRLVVDVRPGDGLVGVEDPQLVIQHQVDRGGADGRLVVGLDLDPALADLPEYFGFGQDHLERSLVESGSQTVQPAPVGKDCALPEPPLQGPIS